MSYRQTFDQRCFRNFNLSLNFFANTQATRVKKTFGYGKWSLTTKKKQDGPNGPLLSYYLVKGLSLKSPIVKIINNLLRPLFF